MELLAAECSSVVNAALGAEGFRFMLAHSCTLLKFSIIKQKDAVV